MSQRQQKSKIEQNVIAVGMQWIRAHVLEILSVIVILIVSAAVRWISFDQYLFFGFEQGRDFLAAQQILDAHDFILVGPKTDIAGIFHGAYYYYVLAALLTLTRSPILLALITSLFSIATVYVIYLILRPVVASRALAYIGAITAAFSYHYILYARWLSNVSPAVFFGAVAFYGLHRYKQTERQVFFVIFIASFFFAAQFQIILSLWGAFLLLLLTLFRVIPRPRIRALFLSAGIVAALYSPLLLFNLRNDWITLRSALVYTQSSEHETVGFVQTLLQYGTTQVTQLQKHIFDLPGVVVLSIYTVLVALTLLKRTVLATPVRDTLLLSLVWILMSLPALFFPHSLGLVQLYVLSGIGLLIATACLFYTLRYYTWGRVVQVFIALLFALNAGVSINKLRTHSDVFFTTIQTGHIFRDQQALLGYIGNATEGKPHHFAAFTIPYYQDEGWRYLHQYYLRSENTIASDTVYLVIEEPVDPHWREVWTSELGPTVLVETVPFNYFTLEVRKKIESSEQ